MAYMIRRNGDGAYVARPGSARSYVKGVENARKFDTIDAALRDCCGNEHVVHLFYDNAVVRRAS